MAVRPLLNDKGGGGELVPTGILADPPTHPPTHPHQKFSGKNENYQRGPKWEVNFRYTNFGPLNPPFPRVLYQPATEQRPDASEPERGGPANHPCHPPQHPPLTSSCYPVGVSATFP